jgi:peptide chain release factor 2
LTNYGGFFDVNEKEKRIDQLTKQMAEVNFWDDKETAEKVIEESNNLKKSIEKIAELRTNIDDNLEMLEVIGSSPDEEMREAIEQELPIIDKKFSSLSLEIMLNGPYDKMMPYLRYMQEQVEPNRVIGLVCF